MPENPVSELIAPLPFGELRTYDDNEVWIRALGKQDPGKLRISLPASLVESNLGCISFNIERDGQMKLDEYAYVMARLRPDRDQGLAGALYVAIRPPNHDGCKEVLYLDNNVARFRVPIEAPGLGSGGGSGDKLVSGDGRFTAVMQDDGNFVVYKEGAPIFATDTGGQ